MDSGSYKLYHVHGYDSRQALEDYFADKPDMAFVEDSLIFPIENLTKTFTEGHFKGDVLIDLSSGPLVHHLFMACEIFRHIIVLRVRDRCILELKRWLDTRTGAFNWGHATKIHLEKEDKSDQLLNKEEKVRSVVQHVMKCDVEQENMTDPIVLPPADCIISAWLLDKISKDQDDYIRYLRKFSGLLKPGGHLILIGCLDTTYFTVGKEMFHFLTYDEDFVRKALVGEGFVIDNCVVKKRTAVSDLIDYKAGIFIAAHKEK
ncbi:indolethylamine N-methyltransferase-like [Hyla sarda]|uniref:indolethylamine N-methyltransferase-like n=1 Tax=Hyla sarda TaxID=327740 RepID=UPI0024C41870|nr:indolethylamine N-methyltransferase-like [Hyla sarda]